MLYDDISLAPGQLRIRAKGSAGGHNESKVLSSIWEHRRLNASRSGSVKNRKDTIWRITFWGGLPEDRDVMEDAFSRAASAAAKLLTEDIGSVMNTFNRTV